MSYFDDNFDRFVFGFGGRAARRKLRVRRKWPRDLRHHIDTQISDEDFEDLTKQEKYDDDHVD